MMKKLVISLFGALFVLASLSSYLWFKLYTANEALAVAYANAEAHRQSTSKELALREATIDELADKLTFTSKELAQTEQSLKDEQDRNDMFEDQIDDIADTVGDLDKLSKLDSELLEKYSKVYFLNENYIPQYLREIDDTWKYSEDKFIQLDKHVISHLEDMLEDALDDNINIWVVSGYRSFYEQATLKGNYTTLYGTGANTFSADQGYSEHQLGTTVDFTTDNLGGGLDGFESTEAYTWLTKNAYKYGFILSYPQSNTYYTYEPWHWRFVGEDLARDLNRKNAHFYDLEQRTIDTYLLHIFD